MMTIYYWWIVFIMESDKMLFRKQTSKDSTECENTDKCLRIDLVNDK